MSTLTDSIINPLAALYNNGGYDFTYLTYPIKFDNLLQQGHYMNFYINMNSNSSYYTGKNSYALPTTPKLFGILPVGNGSINTSFKEFSPINVGGLTGGSGTSIGTNPNVFGMDASMISPMKRITSAISLYIPNNINFSGNLNWNDDSLTKRFGKGLGLLQAGAQGASAVRSLYDAYKSGGDLISAAKTVAGQNAALFYDLISLFGNPQNSVVNAFTSGDWATRVGGFAINEQILFLYKSVDLRHFAFDFFFTPSNETEAATVQNIIKTFRFHARPEVSGDGILSGRYHIAPSTFDIEFFHKGSRNAKIQQISTCALTNYTVDYAPSGWATHTDGMPVQTHLHLEFTETEIITRNKVNEGY